VIVEVATVLGSAPASSDTVKYKYAKNTTHKKEKRWDFHGWRAGRSHWRARGYFWSLETLEVKETMHYNFLSYKFELFNLKYFYFGRQKLGTGSGSGFTKKRALVSGFYE
jgi:hypothetical protein